MDLKYVIPEVRETFGQLTFAGNFSETREGSGANRKVVSRTYDLYSNVQRADNIQVTIPVAAGEKNDTLEPFDRVRLINPRIAAVGYRIAEAAFVNYTCMSDDFVKI